MEKVRERFPVGKPEEMSEETSEDMSEDLSEDAGGDNPYAHEWAVVHVRYKAPDAGENAESTQMDIIVDDGCVMGEMDDDMSWAAGVAQAGMILENSAFAGSTDLHEVRQRLKGLTGNDEFLEEFVYLLTKVQADDA